MAMAGRAKGVAAQGRRKVIPHITMFVRTGIFIIPCVTVGARTIGSAIAIIHGGERLCMAGLTIKRAVRPNQFWVIMGCQGNRNPSRNAMTDVTFFRGLNMILRFSRRLLVIVTSGALTGRRR